MGQSETATLPPAPWDSYSAVVPLPDWEVWSNARDAELADAVLLSLNIKPGCVLAWPRDGEPIPLLAGGSVDGRDISFRRQIAEANTSRLQSKKIKPPRICLRRFAKLANELGWPLPPQFPRFTPKPKPTSSTDPAVAALTRELNSLRSMLAGACLRAGLISRDGAAFSRGRNSVKRLLESMQEAGESLDEKTVRKHLDDLARRLSAREI